MAADNSSILKSAQKGFLGCIILFLLTIPLTACAGNGDNVLELEDIQFLKIKKPVNKGNELEISGLVFHSSLSIHKVSEVKNENCIQLIVVLTSLKTDFGGNLKYTLFVPGNVNCVVFGNKKVLIWER